MSQFFKPKDTVGSMKTGFSNGGKSKQSRQNPFMNTTGQNSQGLMEGSNTRTSGLKCPSIYKDRNKALSMKNAMHLKQIKKSPELIKFYIRQKFGSDIPVNARLENYQQGYIDEHYKVEKYLHGSTDPSEDISNLCYLYDDFLEEVPDRHLEEQAMQESQKAQYADVRKQIYNMLNLR